MVKTYGMERCARRFGRASFLRVWSCLYIANYQCIEGMATRCFLIAQTHVRPRFCRPERYEIRRVIHANLVSHTAGLEERMSREPGSVYPQEFPCVVQDVQDLKILVRLLDEVLLDEYCNDHGSLDSADIQQGCLACSFCGSCLFLSSFYCRRCSQGDSAPLLVCAGCYVDGRSCNCDVMDPVRVGNFQDVLRDRNYAVDSILKSSHLHNVSTEGLVEVSERQEPWLA